MTVQELIDKLQTFPPKLPVELKVYGGGSEDWVPLEETQIGDMINGEGDRVCEIDATYN